MQRTRASWSDGLDAAGRRANEWCGKAPPGRPGTIAAVVVVADERGRLPAVREYVARAAGDSRLPSYATVRRVGPWLEVVLPVVDRQLKSRRH
jgi:hypothetical protein